MAGTQASIKTWDEHYRSPWKRGTGAQRKHLKLVFDADIHKDGTSWKIARLMPVNNYSDIKIRTDGLPNVTIDLGCVGHERDCKGKPVNEDLTYFANALDVGSKLCGDLDCGPWDCRGSCKPECCDDDLTDDCPPAPTHIAEPHDIVLTIHGDVEDCAVLNLTFEYTN